MKSTAATAASRPLARDGRLPLALALLTGGGLLFEIALTRLLSVLFFSTYTYLVLSIAVLGLGAGAALATLSVAARRPRHIPLSASLAGVAATALTHFGLLTEGWGASPLLLLLTFLPYLFVGLAVASLFADHSEISPRLYLADLGGAGVGALLAVPLLDLLGGAGGMLAAALALPLAGLILAPRSPLPLLATLLVGGALLFQLWGVGPQVEPSRLAAPKPLTETLRQGATLAATRWDSLARTDLVHSDDLDRYLIYLDGGAGSLVPDASRPGSWSGDIGALAFAVRPPAESAFLIGPGGGLDIALARSLGTEEIVAAEINRSAVALTRGLEEHAGDLYGPGTELIVDDGRSALRRRGGEYDLILLSQVVSGAAEARGLALVENGLYTTEAFGSYLEHLSPQGRIALKLYDELTLTRAMGTALAALVDAGAEEQVAARHLFAALDTSANPPVPLLLVNGSPLPEPQAIAWAREAEERGFALLFVPGLIAPPQLQRILDGDAGLEVITGADDVDLRPTTDTRPFFYQFERGLPRTLRPLAWSLAALLLLTVAFAVVRPVRGVTTPTDSGAPAAGLTRAAAGARSPAKVQMEPVLAPIMVAALGVGFMLVEIGVLQRSQLLIGNPSLTLATVLAALLLGAACGSGAAARCGTGREYRWVSAAASLAALLALAWSAAWPPAAQLMRSLPPGGAAGGTALLALPLAFALGVPFPLLLRSLGRRGAAGVAAAWAVNGVASVGGAVAATALAIVWGFGSVAWAAALCYGLTAILGGVLSYRR